MNLSTFNRDGFVLLKNFFNPEEIGHIFQEARSVFHIQFVQKGFTRLSLENISETEFNACLYRLFQEDFDCLSNCGKQIQHLISLHRLSLDSRIEAVLREAGMRLPSISTRPVLYFNHPNLAKKKVYHTVDAHQDWRSMQGSLNAIVVWVPLIDIDKSLGALQIIPGSHLQGLKAEKMQDGFGMLDDVKDEFISVEVQRGDVLVFSSLLVHQSGAIEGDKPRWSCHFRYNDLKEETFIQRGYPHAYLYRPVEELITPGFPNLDDIKKTYQQ